MKIKVKERDNVLYMELESNSLAVSVRKDLEFNKRLQVKATRYWKQLGYDITFSIKFNDKIKMYELRSNDLVNGLPKEGLILSTRNRLVL